MSSTRSAEQVRWDALNAWIASADLDARTAAGILTLDLPSYEPASFHAQQVAEKALKALLTLADARVLTRYAVDSRDPSGLAPAEGDVARSHVALGRRVVDHVAQVLAPYLAAGRPAR